VERWGGNNKTKDCYVSLGFEVLVVAVVELEEEEEKEEGKDFIYFYLLCCSVHVIWKQRVEISC
jgi:hypothetical protein